MCVLNLDCMKFNAFDIWLFLSNALLCKLSFMGNEILGWICCDICDLWFDKKCCMLLKHKWERLQDCDEDWHCHICVS